MNKEKCKHCGRVFEHVWFQRESLRIRRERHEARCACKTPAEREYYLQHGRWMPPQPKRRVGAARRTGKRQPRPAARH